LFPRRTVSEKKVTEIGCLLFDCGIKSLGNDTQSEEELSHLPSAEGRLITANCALKRHRVEFEWRNKRDYHRIIGVIP
jgi:hypothetical protein